MMNENIRERMNSEFANMAVMHKTFEDKLEWNSGGSNRNGSYTVEKVYLKDGTQD
jgi:hypothetical protein